jgi:hypothetical protein
LSTAAPANPQANSSSQSQGYSVARPHGKCALTGAPIAEGEKFMALLRETPMGLERLDIAMTAWPEADKTGALAFWQCIMPRHDQVKKKLFVDDEVLCTLFERLADTTEENKLHFRFVLGLILMRKRLLVYEKTERQGDADAWIVRFKGKDEKLSMIDPRLSEEQVKAVSSQLGEIMNEEL